MSRAGYIPAKSWKDYDIGDPGKSSREQLIGAVRKAAKAANQRLLRFERAGIQKGMYQNAMIDLSGRRRYKERPEKLSLTQLRHEYTILRNFLSAKTSTIQGRRDTILKRYATAVGKGYDGDLSDFEVDIERFFAKEAETLFSSDVIYTAIVQGHTDVLSRIVQEQSILSQKDKGKALIAYLKYKPKDSNLLT